MTYLQTYQDQWHEAGQGTDQSDTTGMAYDITYAGTTTAPTAAYLVSPETNGLRMRFLIADENGEAGTCAIWGWDKTDDTNPVMLCKVYATAGSFACTTNPADGTETLTNFFFADTITIDTNENAWDSTVQGYSAQNNILELWMDARGISKIIGDWDMDIGGGTDGTDGIMLAKGY